MASESTFEKTVVKYLKGKGCVVFKLKPGPGVGRGTPDRLFLKKGFWGFLEVKKNEDAKYQPLQKEKIAFFHGWSYARAVYPENWNEIKKELDTIL